MFKLLSVLPFVASLAGTVIAAPIGSDISSLLARKNRNQVVAAAPAAGAAGTLAPCTPIDQSAAAFSGNGPDLNLQDCRFVDAPDVPFPCTNGQAVADAFNLPFCNTVNTPAATAEIAAAAASSSAASAAAAQATGNLVPCTNTDQSAAAFSGNDPDENLIPCSFVDAPDVPFECTNIDAVTKAFGTPPCNTVNTPAASAAVAAAAASSSAASAAAAQATGKTVQCTNADQSAAAFSGNDPDENLTPCSFVNAPDVPFECTNIPAVTKAFGTPPCSSAPAA
ncbi:hypothetical protein MVEN_01836300 [Mycena venus]|uniref:Uncharacterized protein n=1 Tax=Mycena venus TaxID=2733690 RepID=A0A8H6XJ37_9AGAR|nr:hypothetical protein MVEN_01836300 [Mycena venus]